ncbi:MAG: FAD-binding oxidoreductase, partial [Hyphomicrobiaceae bacterium]|nr:FAD-binding oxidoreductase [Hyphomicrobiaceae bacterium]
LYALSLDGVDAIRGLLRDAGREDLIGGTGWLKLVRHDDPALYRRFEVMTAHYGARYRYLDRDGVRALLTTERYFAGLVDERCFHIDPLAFSRLVADRAEAAGAEICEAAPVSDLEREGAGWTARIGAVRIRAKQVVLAHSGYGQIHPALDRAILPIATYVVTTEKLGPRLGEAIRFAGCIGDTRRASDYYRIVDGDRLLWGGRITTRVSEPADLAARMKRDILSVYPQLGDVAISHVWSGLMGYAVHKMPLIGQWAPGLWSATAFGGHGLNTTMMGGALVASAIAGGDARWKLFSPFRPRWGGGALGRLATQLEYWRLQLLDRVEENRALQRSA